MRVLNHREVLGPQWDLPWLALKFDHMVPVDLCRMNKGFPHSCRSYCCFIAITVADIMEVLSGSLAVCGGLDMCSLLTFS